MLANRTLFVSTSKIFRTSEKIEIDSNFKSTSNLLFVTSAVLHLPLLLFPETIIWLLYGDPYVEAADVLQYLMGASFLQCALIPISVVYIASASFKKHVKTMAVSTFIYLIWMILAYFSINSISDVGRFYFQAAIIASALSAMLFVRHFPELRRLSLRVVVSCLGATLIFLIV
jgi:O-antigen/teichoic acid export membrane protein